MFKPFETPAGHTTVTLASRNVCALNPLLCGQEELLSSSPSQISYLSRSPDEYPGPLKTHLRNHAALDIEQDGFSAEHKGVEHVLRVISADPGVHDSEVAVQAHSYPEMDGTSSPEEPTMDLEKLRGLSIKTAPSFPDSRSKSL